MLFMTSDETDNYVLDITAFREFHVIPRFHSNKEIPKAMSQHYKYSVFFFLFLLLTFIFVFGSAWNNFGNVNQR